MPGRVIASLKKDIHVGKTCRGITDRDAVYHDAVFYVLSEATRDEYVQQFADEDNEIMPITRRLYIDNPKARFFRVSFD